MAIRYQLSISILLLSISLFLFTSCNATITTTTSPTKVLIGNTSYIGTLTNPSAPNIVRDGGASVKLGGNILWTFGDTLFPDTSVDGKNFRSNSAALANLNNPTQLTETLDKNNAPNSFLKFTTQEQAYNDASGRPDERFALWPTALIPASGNKAYVVYNRLKVHSGQLNFEAISTGIAEVFSDRLSATRITELFSVPEAQFNHAAVVRNGMVYLYACELNQLIARCRVAKAPISRITERPAYTFWDGNNWNSDISKAILSVEGSTSGFSVTWNDYLNAYVSVYSEAFSKQVLMRTASEPQGPWSETTVVLTAEDTIYATIQHPALEKDNGRILFVSYYLPESAFKGDLKLHKIELQ